MNPFSIQLKFLKKGSTFTPVNKQSLDELPDGAYDVTIQVRQSNVAQAKKAYFAMVDTLALYCGYMSRKDKELFKEQVKKELGNESIAEMTTIEQVTTKIEELHQLAITEHNFMFPPFIK